MSRMSMEDILKEIEDIAKEGEGADKFRALKMLANLTTSASILPEPLEEPEIIARLVRIMRPAGMGICQIAYNKAFAYGKGLFAQLPAKAKDHDLTDEELGKVPRTLKQLYRRFPEIKGPGFPQGYPVGRSIEMKRAWLREQTIKLLTDRKTKERRAEHAVLKAAHEAITDDAPDQGPILGQPG
jgi:hypothetical protein